jgi:Terpene synthase family 2, C-terminal metal binding
MTLQFSPALRTLLDEYADVAQAMARGERPRIDLTRLVISQWSTNFYRHADTVEAEQIAEEWAKSYGVWVPVHSQKSSTMGVYLHPESRDKDSLIVILKIYLLMFYIDDTISNELQKDLTLEQRAVGLKMMGELMNMLRNHPNPDSVPASQFGSVEAMRSILKDLQRIGDPDWYTRFANFMFDYANDTATDQNRVARGEDIDMDSFIELRNDICGMLVTGWCIDMTMGFNAVKHQLSEDVQKRCARVSYLCTVIGGLVNEFFSFEKEVIQYRDEFHIIHVMMYQYGIGFEEAIDRAFDYVNDLCNEFLGIYQSLMRDARSMPMPQREIVETYARYNMSGVVASWYWELDTDRYEYENSIFMQTNHEWRVANGHLSTLNSGEPFPLRDGLKPPAWPYTLKPEYQP